jgi:hypothetical protein
MFQPSVTTVELHRVTFSLSPDHLRTPLLTLNYIGVAMPDAPLTGLLCTLKATKPKAVATPVPVAEAASSSHTDMSAIERLQDWMMAGFSALSGPAALPRATTPSDGRVTKLKPVLDKLGIPASVPPEVVCGVCGDEEAAPPVLCCSDDADAPAANSEDECWTRGVRVGLGGVVSRMILLATSNMTPSPRLVLTQVRDATTPVVTRPTHPALA